MNQNKLAIDKGFAFVPRSGSKLDNKEYKKLHALEGVVNVVAVDEENYVPAKVKKFNKQ